MKKYLTIISLCFFTLSTFSQILNLDEIFLRSKLLCELDQDLYALNLDKNYIDSLWTCKIITNTRGFDTSKIIFIIVIPKRKTLINEEYFIAYYIPTNMYFRLQGYHENDFRRFMWFFYGFIDKSYNEGRFRNSKRFSKNYYIEGVNLYKLHREWRMIRKSRFIFNSSNVEKRWVNPDL